MAGFAATLSVLFLPAGIALLALAGATLATGLLLAPLAPLIMRARPARCPICGTTSSVFRARRWWHCDGCRQVLAEAPDGRQVALSALTHR